MSETRSAVYMMNKIGPSTEPCGTPHIKSGQARLAYIGYAFITLTLLVGRQEEHPACKN